MRVTYLSDGVAWLLPILREQPGFMSCFTATNPDDAPSDKSRHSEGGGLGVDWMANCFLDKRGVLEVGNSSAHQSVRSGSSHVSVNDISLSNPSPRLSPADARLYSG